MSITRTRDSVSRELHRERGRLQSCRRALAGIGHRLSHARGPHEIERITKTKGIRERELVRLPDKIAQLEAELAAMPEDQRLPSVGGFMPARGSVFRGGEHYRTTAPVGVEGEDLDIPDFLRRA